ncbi:MAG: tetratricopeptide repeat protein [Thermoanaerobaculia bacterium]|nr:tetratricopeptide repeat protein [Thermoanaerobaculia bacterium]
MPRAPRSAGDAAVEDYLDSLAALHERLDEGMSWSGHERNCTFLNPGPAGGGGGFANVSRVSGLDWDDDARGLALLDWDWDGDLDLVLSNRTAPRLRLMRNVGGGTGGSLVVELEGNGSATNRDAIGARVSVATDRGDLIRTLRAGDGFLSQSSKSLHFGLGARRPTGEVRVAWPGGRVETFSGVAAGSRVRLVQGSGRALVLAGRDVAELEARPQRAHEPTSGERVVLPNRPPAPSLTLQPFGAEPVRPIPLGESPLLVNIWASWCVPCRHELEDLARGERTLREAGIGVVALATDGMGDAPTTTAADAAEFMDRIDFPFPNGLATDETLDKIEIVKRYLFDRRFPLGLPFSLLIDAEGNVAALYRGGLDTEALIADQGLLERASALQRRDQSVPLAGRWFTAPRSRAAVGRYARWFQDRYPEESIALLEGAVEQTAARLAAASPEYEQTSIRIELHQAYRDLAAVEAKLGRHAAAADHYRSALDLDPGDEAARTSLLGELLDAGDLGGLESQIDDWLRASPGSSHLHARRADVLLAKDDVEGAAAALATAVDLEPRDHALRVLYGQTLARLDRMPQALAQFEAAVELDPGDKEAHFLAGVLAGGLGRPAEAERHHLAALEIDPGHRDARFELARVYAATGRRERATEAYEAILARDPEDAAVHAGLGLLLVQAGRSDEGVIHVRRAYALDPAQLAAGNEAAWLLATHPEDGLRDGDGALVVAREINERTGHREPALLETLAAAQAETGDFEAAVATIERAIAATEAAGRASEARLLRSRLELYASGRPFRDRSQLSRS